MRAHRFRFRNICPASVHTENVPAKSTVFSIRHYRVDFSWDVDCDRDLPDSGMIDVGGTTDGAILDQTLTQM